MPGLSGDQLMVRLGSTLQGLSRQEAASRLRSQGPNEIARQKPRSWGYRLVLNIRNPLVILLSALALVSFLTGDIRATLVILVMVFLGVILRFFQELRADHAAQILKAMVQTSATVVREGQPSEIPLRELVKGDIILLSAGDMVPADVRILVSKDLFVNQASLTGESIAVEKSALHSGSPAGNPFELPEFAFLGSNVQSGSATALVVRTGDQTFFGSLAISLEGERQLTSFDKGLNRFTWLMIRFMAVMVPAVFLINGLIRQDWVEAFLFALAVAVGLTPEMLPMIVTVNLSKGAIAMSRKKVIVKRLNAIQDFGAMDVLCTDKTGTLTQGRIILEKYIDILGQPSQQVLEFGYLNSYHHTGLKNLMDQAVLDHEELEGTLKADEKFSKVDEIPFDFNRKRMSVVVRDDKGSELLICKGAVENMMDLCQLAEGSTGPQPLLAQYRDSSLKMVHDLNAEGYRVIALAYKHCPSSSGKPSYSVRDESDLILLGFLAFLDPPKTSAAETLQKLRRLQVNVKILTGDNETVTAYICRQVGIEVEPMLLGSQIEAMDDQSLNRAVQEASVFARLVPHHKERIIRALQAGDHVTGFLGDGINDAPALKAADVGISVDSAVDIAKESSDIILLETSLLILENGVAEGRRVFGNIIKYIRMAASSNFGNMFSVVGASAFLPFLPMLPIQVLTNNLLYDFSQTTIPTDRVDEDWLVKPRKWSIRDIERFILLIGPISSIFDYLTFWLMWSVFHCRQNPALFHTGWFVESLFTQTLIIHVIRTNRIPFLESRASWPLMAASLLIVLAGAWLTVSPLAGLLGFVPLPGLFWLYLLGILVAYIFLTQLVKNWFVRRYGD